MTDSKTFFTVKKEVPKILKKPEAVECYEYENAVFETTATGKPKPTVEWTSGDVKLEPSEKMVVETLPENMFRLTLKDVRKTQAGMVTVRAVNEVGDMSASARLRIKGLLYIDIRHERLSSK